MKRIGICLGRTNARWTLAAPEKEEGGEKRGLMRFLGGN